MRTAIIFLYLIPAVTFLYVFCHMSICVWIDLKKEYPEETIRLIGWESIPSVLEVLILAAVPVCNVILAALFVRYYEEMYEELYEAAEVSILITKRVEEELKKIEREL